MLAQEEARKLGGNHIGTEHLLLGLLREEEGVAARVLVALGVTVEEVRTAIVAKQVSLSHEDVTRSANDQLPVTPRAKKALELALREALSLGHNYIGTEHILLGLVRISEGTGMTILSELHPEAHGERIRNEIVRMLSGPSQRPAAGTGLTYEMMRRLGYRVQHRDVPAIRGTLKSYDFGGDMCEVSLDHTEGVLPGQSLQIKREHLVLRP